MSLCQLRPDLLPQGSATCHMKLWLDRSPGLAQPLPPLAGTLTPDSSDQNPPSRVFAFSLTCLSPFAGESDRATLRNVLEGRVSWSSPVAAHLSVDAKDFLQATLQRAPE